jgi:ABC-type enterochelin transport system substrate-binding protein
MSYKHCLSFLLVLFFSSLVACGSSDSKSSGDKKEVNSNSQQTSQETSEVTIKDCVKGDNALKEGESCKISENAWTCKNGGIQIVGGGISSGKSISLKGFKVYCASNPP